MIQIQIEEVIDHLSMEMRHALAAAVREEIPDVDFDPNALFRAFRRAVGRKCGWEQIPAHYIRNM